MPYFLWRELGVKSYWPVDAITIHNTAQNYIISIRASLLYDIVSLAQGQPWIRWSLEEKCRWLRLSWTVHWADKFKECFSELIHTSHEMQGRFCVMQIVGRYQNVSKPGKMGQNPANLIHCMEGYPVSDQIIVSVVYCVLHWAASLRCCTVLYCTVLYCSCLVTTLSCCASTFIRRASCIEQLNTCWWLNFWSSSIQFVSLASWGDILQQNIDLLLCDCLASSVLNSDSVEKRVTNGQKRATIRSFKNHLRPKISHKFMENSLIACRVASADNKI